jgi:hypothetical protein
MQEPAMAAVLDNWCTDQPTAVRATRSALGGAGGA